MECRRARSRGGPTERDIVWTFMLILSLQIQEVATHCKHDSIQCEWRMANWAPPDALEQRKMGECFVSKERPLVFVSIMRDLIYVQALCAITSSVNTATANWILGWAPLSNDISWRVSRPTQFTISPRIVIQYRTRMLDWIECCNIVLQQNVETDWLGTP